MQQTEWITKDAAGKMLDLSPRRVLELAADGQFDKRTHLNPETRRRQVLLSLESVRRYAQMLTQPPQPAPVTAALVPRPMAVAVSARAAAPLPDPTTAWLTLEAAETYTGLPASFLRDLIERGLLAALDVGKRPGGRWRVCRRDLDGISGGIVPQAAGAGMKTE